MRFSVHLPVDNMTAITERVVEPARAVQRRDTYAEALATAWRDTFYRCSGGRSARCMA